MVSVLSGEALVLSLPFLRLGNLLANLCNLSARSQGRRHIDVQNGLGAQRDVAITAMEL